MQHLNLTVADVERSIAFYRTWFGFDREPRRYPDGTVFVNDATGFDLAFKTGTSTSPGPVHVGFRRHGPREVRALTQRLVGAGVPISEQYDEPDYVSVKCLDPDGYEIEVYWEPPVDGHRRELIELSHVIESGMVTYPGLPGPVVGDHLSREDSRSTYAPGTEFHIGRIEMVANTGTYLDTPAHRYADGHDLAGLPLGRVAGVPGVCVRGAGAIGIDAIAAVDTAGRAVLLATGWDRHWRTERYGSPDHPFVTAELATALADGGVAVVGIDSVNIDDTRGGERPAHSILLAAGVPIVEHLTNLDQLVGRDFRFSAIPPRISGMGTFPVRAYAELT